jgi:hypothetical protein
MVSWRASTSAGRVRFFVAAAVAADPEQALWLHDRLAHEQDTPCLRTQRRWVERGGEILGLAGDLPGRVAESVVEVLGIAGMAHQEARRRWAEARDIRGRSRAVVSVLALLTVDESLLFRLLGAGCIGEAFPGSWLFSAEASAFVFPGSGTLPPTAGRSRPPPSFGIGSP